MRHEHFFFLCRDEWSWSLSMHLGLLSWDTYTILGAITELNANSNMHHSIFFYLFSGVVRNVLENFKIDKTMPNMASLKIAPSRLQMPQDFPSLLRSNILLPVPLLFLLVICNIVCCSVGHVHSISSVIVLCYDTIFSVCKISLFSSPSSITPSLFSDMVP